MLTAARTSQRGRQDHAPQDHRLGSSPVSGVSRKARTPFPASRLARAVSQPRATLSSPMYQLWLSLQALYLGGGATRPLAGGLFQRPPALWREPPFSGRGIFRRGQGGVQRVPGSVLAGVIRPDAAVNSALASGPQAPAGRVLQAISHITCRPPGQMVD